MSTGRLLLLHLALLIAVADTWAAPPTDPARLRELLHNRESPRGQSQAALLLVQSPSSDAEEIVHEGLRQTDAVDVFSALATAVRLEHDGRFRDDLLAALIGGPPAIRQEAAAALAPTADARVVLRLQALAEDAKHDLPVRQAALWVLGHCGRKSAVVVLLDQLSNENETLRRDAAAALAELTGVAYGVHVARWRAWWEKHKDLDNERWLEERLAYQTSRAHRLEGDLERAKAQVVRLHQQLYARLPLADRLGHVQTLLEHEDPGVRALAVGWSAELLPGADTVGQRVLTDLLLRLSRDGQADVQRAAVLALGRVADDRAFDRLRHLLQRGCEAVRVAAARALTQQARGGPEASARQRQVVPILQKALEDSSLEVVVEVAEDLGVLGAPEAGPVLAVLLRHPSGPVRQAAAQALERVADLNVLDGLLEALDDAVATVRFSLVGALGHAAGDGQTLSEAQRTRLLTRLEGALIRDADPGVRSRAATVLGECGPPAALPALWRRVQAAEENRVQEKSWAALIEILARVGSLELLQEWDHRLAEAKQEPRRLQLLEEIAARWSRREDTKTLAGTVLEALVQTQLEQGKWAAAFPVIRELLTRPGADGEMDKRLRWLLQVGEQALKEGNRSEALRAVQEAQPYLARRKSLAGDFEKLEKKASQER
jgi:HEAT repeat protein